MHGAVRLAGLAVLLAVPVVLALFSPLLQWRDGVYIAAGLAGVVTLPLLTIHVLLAGGFVPGLSRWRSRRLHVVCGIVLIAAVAIHVVGLWVVSPPDVVDALLFSSPTPFSAWGVVAMWALLVAALLAALRPRLGLRPRHWRQLHSIVAGVVVLGAVVHALLIEGTMETVSKTSICVAAIVILIWTIVDMGAFRR